MNILVGINLLKITKVIYNGYISFFKMYVKDHFIVSIILSILLFSIFKWNVLLILVGGVLIDVDHYLLYYMKFKKFDLVKGYKYFSEKDCWKELINSLSIFHTVEFLILMIVLSFYYKLFILMVIGMVPHLIMDFIYESKATGRLVKCPSFIYWLTLKREY